MKCSVGYELGHTTVGRTINMFMEETSLNLALNIKKNWDQQRMG